MRLLLISGHGAGDPGAVGEYRGRTWREADETRRVTAAVAEALKGDWDVTIYPTDRNAFDDHQKGTLAAVAQFRRYDYVLEIHFNAYRQTAERIMQVTTSPVVYVAAALAVVVVAAVAFALVRRRQQRKKEEAERMERILDTPLEKFGDKDVEDLAQKYEDK